MHERLPDGSVVRRFEAPVPPEAVFALIADPSRVPELHPLVRSVVVTFDGLEAGRRVRRFTVDERVPFGPFDLPNRYRAEAAWRPDGAAPPLTLTAFAAGGVRVTHRWTFDAMPGGARVVQVVTVAAPRCLHGFVDRTAVRAHDRYVHAVRQALAAHPER